MWLLPSKGRPLMLAQCLESALKAGMTTPGRILLDSSDPTIDEYKNLQLPRDWELYIVKDSPEEPIPCVGKSIRSWIKENKDYCDNCLWIGWFNDDHSFVTKEWDLMLLDETKGLRVLCVNDKWQSPNRMTGPTVWSGDLFRLADRGIYFPKFCHMYMDNAWEVIGVNTGTWCAHMGVIVEHNHWTKHKEIEPDATTKYAESFLMKDKETFAEWINSEAPKVVGRIRSMNIHNTYKHGIHMFTNTERRK